MIPTNRELPLTDLRETDHLSPDEIADQQQTIRLVKALRWFVVIVDCLFWTAVIALVATIILLFTR